MGSSARNLPRQSFSTSPICLAIVFGVIGAVLTYWLTGLWWGATLSVVLPAGVPFWTKRRQIKAAASAATKVVSNFADASYNEDAKPSHGLLKRCAVTLVLLGASVFLCGLQLETKQESGWWWVMMCVPLTALFRYAAFQWCRPGRVGRDSMFAAAAFTVGLGGNFTAGAMTTAGCARRAEEALTVQLQSVAEGVTHLLNWTKQKDKKDAQLADKVAEMDSKLDEIMRSQATSVGGTASTSQLALTSDEITLLERIRAEGTPLQQARAILLLASDARSEALWDETDSAIRRLEADRQRGLWRSSEDEERFLLLKGDRFFFADDPNGAISPYLSATAAFANSTLAWVRLGRAHANARGRDTTAQWAAAQKAYENGLSVAAMNDPLLGALHSNLGGIQLLRGDLASARINMERSVAIESSRPIHNLPNLAMSFNNLAAIQLRTGDLQGAKANLTRAIDAQSRFSVPDDPNFAVFHSNLAMVFRAEGNLTAARANMERAIAIDAKHLSTDHPNFATDYNNLALICLRQGDRVAASVNFKRALKILLKHFDENHPDVRNIRDSMKREGFTD